jgi:hypothetical protein
VNARALNALAAVILAAQEKDRTPMGIAIAVESAGLLLSPESAAELEQLRSARRVEHVWYCHKARMERRERARADRPTGEVRALRAERAETNTALTLAVEDNALLRARVAELMAELRIGTPWTCGPCGKENTRDVCVVCETDRPEADEEPYASRLLPARDALCGGCGHSGADHHHAGTKCWVNLPRASRASMAEPLPPLEICGCKAFAAAEVTS